MAAARIKKTAYKFSQTPEPIGIRRLYFCRFRVVRYQNGTTRNGQ
jgi:hypothetical protein